MLPFGPRPHWRICIMWLGRGQCLSRCGATGGRWRRRRFARGLQGGFLAAFGLESLRDLADPEQLADAGLSAP